jgi:hypothetical protein
MGSSRWLASVPMAAVMAMAPAVMPKSQSRNQQRLAPHARRLRR